MNPAAADSIPGVPSPRTTVPPIDPDALLDTDLSAPADSTTQLAATGKADQLTTSALHVACESALRPRCRHLIADLSEVTFMSSTKINLLVSLQRRTDCAWSSTRR
ncbi:STAS domain-containing protein [Amycolatopsis sp. cmx-8-4]|uniref:STAS domain-containing protein n=1 Tax=Amycolatopsis sp. cmx-8-4 TaxID=2790947 RepID=UPI00397DA6F0